MLKQCNYLYSLMSVVFSHIRQRSSKLHAQCCNPAMRFLWQINSGSVHLGHMSSHRHSNDCIGVLVLTWQ
jgi:hypothetical protein